MWLNLNNMYSLRLKVEYSLYYSALNNAWAVLILCCPLQNPRPLSRRWVGLTDLLDFKRWLFCSALFLVLFLISALFAFYSASRILAINACLSFFILFSDLYLITKFVPEKLYSRCLSVALPFSFLSSLAQAWGWYHCLFHPFPFHSCDHVK